MTEGQTINLSREQLYNEIWELSASGVAKKYNVPYAELLKLCREANIPYPPSGYWTKRNFGKAVTKTPLPESPIIEVSLQANSALKRSKCSSKPTAGIELNEDSKVMETPEAMEESEVPGKQQAAGALDTYQDDQPTYRTVNGKQNIYNREKLYEEVWAKPVVEVAAQYGVSDVAIHKICKSLNVPVHPVATGRSSARGKK